MRHSDVILKIGETGKAILPHDSQLYLYGSRARGDYHQGSDWDLLILLNKREITQNDYDYVYEFSKTGAMIDETIVALIYTKQQWEERKGSDFYNNVENDKVVLL